MVCYKTSMICYEALIPCCSLSMIYYGIMHARIECNLDNPLHVIYTMTKYLL